MLHVATGELSAHDLTTNFWSTPVIADARGTGTLELIGLGWTVGENTAVAVWRDLNWRLLRMDLDANGPAFRSWAAYMGTATNGIYRPPD